MSDPSSSSEHTEPSPKSYSGLPFRPSYVIGKPLLRTRERAVLMSSLAIRKLLFALSNSTWKCSSRTVVARKASSAAVLRETCSCFIDRANASNRLASSAVCTRSGFRRMSRRGSFSGVRSTETRRELESAPQYHKSYMFAAPALQSTLRQGPPRQLRLVANQPLSQEAVLAKAHEKCQGLGLGEGMARLPGLQEVVGLGS